MKEEEKCECDGVLEPYIDDDISCSCHINPPCSKCTDDRSVCKECGEILSPEYKPVKQSPIPTYHPRSDMKSGISYTAQRSGGWIITTGTYKKGMSYTDVKEKLGNFDKYHMFLFKNIHCESFEEYGVFKASWCTD